MPVNIFEIPDYRAVIEAFILSNRTERAYRTRLSQAAGCHLSYLTRVLQSKCDLTPDHAYGLSHFWNLGDAEAEFFLTTVYLARASSPGLKRKYRAQLEKLKDTHNDLGRQTGVSRTINFASDIEYYASWYTAAIHLLTAVPEFQTPTALAKKVGLEEGLVKEILKKLLEMKLVHLQKDRFVCSRGGLHVPRGSSLAWLHLSNWRHRALANAQRTSADLHFTSVYSLSKKDAQALKDLLVKYISQCEAILTDSPDETVIAINLDLFEV
jgi:uncharacterized protein (TIGR02147 family)